MKQLQGKFISTSLAAQWYRSCLAMQETLVQALCLSDPLEEKTGPTLVFLARKCHGQRSLAGYSHKELDTTEQLPNSKLIGCPSLHLIVFHSRYC